MVELDTDSVQAYDSTNNVSQLVGGKKRRHNKSQKRGGKKHRRSQRKHNMHGGNKDSNDLIGPGQANNLSGPGTVGGKKRYRSRRPRKGKKGKKSRKGKASNWISHVKNFARVHKMKFPIALKDPRCKAEYKKMK